MIGVHQHYVPIAIQGSFNTGAEGILTGTVDLFVDDGTMTSSLTQPWVIPHPANLRRVMVSFGPALLTPAYDLNIYLNGGIHTTLALVLADKQSVHVIDIPVVAGDEIGMSLVQTSGVGNTFEDLVAEIFS